VLLFVLLAFAAAKSKPLPGHQYLQNAQKQGQKKPQKQKSQFPGQPQNRNISRRHYNSNQNRRNGNQNRRNGNQDRRNGNSNQNRRKDNSRRNENSRPYGNSNQNRLQDKPKSSSPYLGLSGSFNAGLSGTGNVGTSRGGSVSDYLERKVDNVAKDKIGKLH
jgi:hypothetical protein